MASTLFCINSQQLSKQDAYVKTAMYGGMMFPLYIAVYIVRSGF
jgi:hypothetical protein